MGFPVKTITVTVIMALLASIPLILKRHPRHLPVTNESDHEREEDTSRYDIEDLIS
jgi:hypothetical protein